MRKVLASTLIGALIIVAVVVAIVVAGCGTAATQGAAQTQPAPTTAQGILAKAFTSTESLTSGTGQLNASVAVNGDTSKMPAGMAALLGQPINLSGTFAFNKDPQAVDASATASVAGQKMTFGLKGVDNKAWVQFMGQWYEAPAEGTQATGTTGTTISQADKTAIAQAITAAGIDPTTWLTNLTLANETLNNTQTYHITGTIDVSKVMADVTKLTQDPTFMSLVTKMMSRMASSGMLGPGTESSTNSTAVGGSSTSVTMPSAQELQQVQSQLAAMIKNLTVDIWVAQGTYQLRQVQIDATIVPPAGQDTQGINSITLKATVSVAPATTPLTVTAPTDVKPFSDLQKALSGLQSMFSGLFSSDKASGTTGTTGSTGATATTTTGGA